MNSEDMDETQASDRDNTQEMSEEQRLMQDRLTTKKNMVVERLLSGLSH